MEINEENLKQYFQKIIPNINLQIKDFTIDELTPGGDSGFVYPIKCELKNNEKVILYIKQTRDYAKTAIDIKVDPQRIYWEYQALIYFEKVLGIGVVPHVYYFDEKQNVLVMSDIVQGGSLLIDELANDNILPNLGKHFGELFGKLHFIKNDFKLEINKEHQDWLKGALIEYNLAGAKKILPKETINRIISESDNATHTIIWGDAKPKNIVIKNSSIKFFDLETVINWDVAYDTGTLLSHWFLKISEGKTELTNQAVIFINNFWKSYIEIANQNKISNISGLKERTINYIATAMLHRTDGLDLYNFSEELKDKIRQDARNLLRNEYSLIRENKIQLGG